MLVPCMLLHSIIMLRVNTLGSLLTRLAVCTMKAFSIGKCQARKVSCPSLTPAEDIRLLQAAVSEFLTILGCLIMYWN